MAKYFLFAWQDYEERGGLNDLLGVHETFRQAQLALLSIDEGMENAQIATFTEDDYKIVAKYRKSRWSLDAEGNTMNGYFPVEMRWLKVVPNEDARYTTYAEVDFLAKEPQE